MSAPEISIPSFRAGFRVEVVDGEGAFLLSENGHTFLRGQVYCALAELIDGARPADAIVDALIGRARTADVYYALYQLAEQGYIVEADGIGAQTPEHAAFWDLLELDPLTAARRTATATVSIMALGDVEADPLSAALTALNVSTGDNGEFAAVLTDDYGRAELRDVNAAALKAGRSWLLVKPIGAVVWIGPVFRPGRSACWECLAQRLATNRQVESYLHTTNGPTPTVRVARAGIPASEETAIQLAALEVTRAIVGDDVVEADATLVTLDLRTVETQRHVVVRRPQCPACNPASLEQPRKVLPVTRRPRPVQFARDGGYREIPPERTYERFEHHVSPISGVVSELRRASAGEDAAIHVYSANHNPAVRHPHLDLLRKGLRTNSAGKGKTDAQARTSALCEALERYCGIFQGDEARERASFDTLGELAIHPNRCMLFSESQYEHRDEWNAARSSFQHVPEPLDESAEIDWSPAWSLTEQRFKYLPTGYCYYGHHSSGDDRFFRADSNGCAAGNSLEEAILQAFLELVERDSVALWWYNRVRRPGVDLESFDDPYVHDLKQCYSARGRDLWVLDITSDLAIPAYAAVAVRSASEREEILVGFGAHFDSRIGVLRALTELNQFLLAVDNSAEVSLPEVARRYDPDLFRWFDHATIESQPYLSPLESPPIQPREHQLRFGIDIRADVERCQCSVEAKGMELLVLDQTRPDIGLPVVKVFVPGLRHFWARFAPGRLYDVPVTMGWRDEPVPPAELNPFPMFV